MIAEDGDGSSAMRPAVTVLIVDQYVLFCEGLERLLASEPDFAVIGSASRLSEAVEKAVRLRPDLVLIDVDLADGSGLDGLREIMAQRPESTVVMLANRASDEALLTAIRCGARGFLLKDMPFATLLAALRALRQGEMALSRAMTSRVVREFCRAPAASLPAIGLASLTPRERQVLFQLGAGASNREIAARLAISEYTVKAHVRNLLEKLGLKNRSQAAGVARRLGLMPPAARDVH